MAGAEGVLYEAEAPGYGTVRLGVDRRAPPAPPGRFRLSFREPGAAAGWRGPEGPEEGECEFLLLPGGGRFFARPRRGGWAVRAPGCRAAHFVDGAEFAARYVPWGPGDAEG